MKPPNQHAKRFFDMTCYGMNETADRASPRLQLLYLFQFTNFARAACKQALVALLRDTREG